MCFFKLKEIASENIGAIIGGCIAGAAVFGLASIGAAFTYRYFKSIGLFCILTNC